MFDPRTSATTLHDTHFRVASIAVGIVVAIAVGMSLTGTAHAETKPTVLLNVNGETSSVTTDAPTVGDLLERKQIHFDSNDRLTPGPAQQISNGLEVSLTNVVHLTVIDDGDKASHLVAAVTVNQARSELGLSNAKRVAFSPYDEFAFERTGFHAPSGKHLDGRDRVREDSVAVVHDVRVAFPGDTFRVKHKTVRDHSKLVRKGSTRIYQHGHNGRKHVIWKKRFVDGNLAMRKVAKSRWLKEPQRKIIYIGTGPNWVGLARCESSGNPNAVNPAGFYGLYQFSLSTWHSVGGKGNPTDYGYWEQTKRAWILFRHAGRSPWPVCGRYL